MTVFDNTGSFAKLLEFDRQVEELTAAIEKHRRGLDALDERLRRAVA